MDITQQMGASFSVIPDVDSRKKVKHIVIDGSVPGSRRQGLVDTFQQDGRVRAAVLSIQAAGVGLTLTVPPLPPPPPSHLTTLPLQHPPTPHTQPLVSRSEQNELYTL